MSRRVAIEEEKEKELTPPYPPLGDAGAAAKLRTVEAHFVAEHHRRYLAARSVAPPPKYAPSIREIARWAQRSGYDFAAVDRMLERFFSCPVARERDFRASHLEHYCESYAKGVAVKPGKPGDGQGGSSSANPAWRPHPAVSGEQVQPSESQPSERMRRLMAGQGGAR